MYLYEKKLTKFMYDYCFGENINRDNFEEEVIEVSIDEYNNGKLPSFAAESSDY